MIDLIQRTPYPILLCSAFIICILLRILQGLFLHTAFNPDEIWQNQAVAYTLAFPTQANLYTTWEWQPYAKIRSYVHPLLTYFFYQFLITFNIDTQWLVAWGPRLFHGIICGIADVFLFKLIAILINFLPQMYQDVKVLVSNDNDSNGSTQLSTQSSGIVPKLNKIQNPSTNDSETSTSLPRRRSTSRRRRATNIKEYMYDDNDNDEIDNHNIIPQNNKKSRTRSTSTNPSNKGYNDIEDPSLSKQHQLEHNDSNSTPNTNKTTQIGHEIPYLQCTLSQFRNFFTSISFITVFIWLINWFSAYCYTRPYSNSIECALIIIALSFWPFFYFSPSKTIQRTIKTTKYSPRTRTSTETQRTVEETIIGGITTPSIFIFFNNLTFSLIFAALSVLFRVTAIILWVPLYLIGFVQLLWFNGTFTLQESPRSKFVKLFLYIIIPIIIGIIAIITMIEIDAFGYKQASPLESTIQCMMEKMISYELTPSHLITKTNKYNISAIISHYINISTECIQENYSLSSLSLYNFYKINKAHNIASLYGENHPLFSIIASIPVTTSALLPFTILGCVHFFSLFSHFLCKYITLSSQPSNINTNNDDDHKNESAVAIDTKSPPQIASLSMLYMHYINRIVLLFYFAFFLPIFYCTNKHQEYRFILPAVPFLYLFAAHAIAWFWSFPPTSFNHIKNYMFLTVNHDVDKQHHTSTTLFTSSNSSFQPPILSQTAIDNIKVAKKRIKTIYIILFVLNLIVTWFFFRIHQRGPFVLMDQLHHIGADIAKNSKNFDTTKPYNIGVLLPGCHQIPYPTFFHSQNLANNDKNNNDNNNNLQFSFISPDCSPLFSLPRNNNEGNNNIDSIPCWLNQSDQFALLSSFLPSKNNTSTSNPSQLLPQNCASSVNKPMFPGRNWVSPHEQAKSHPILFFLRHIIAQNLLQLEETNPKLFSNQNNKNDNINNNNDTNNNKSQTFDPTLFYQDAVDRYISTLQYVDGTSTIAPYNKSVDINLLDSLLTGFVTKSTQNSQTKGKNGDKTIDPNQKDQIDMTSPQGIAQIEKIVSLLQHRRLSNRPNSNESPFFTSQKSQIDPFAAFQTQFSLPKLLDSSNKTTQDHSTLENPLFFPDIVVVYTQEQEVLDPILTLFNYRLESTILHCLTEPDEKELFIYVQN